MAFSSIEFLLKNNVAVIQFVFAFIFCLAVFIILKSFKEENETSVVAAKPAKFKEFTREDSDGAAAKSADAKLPMDDDFGIDDLDNLDDLLGVEDKSTTAAPAAGPATAPTPAPAPVAEVPPAVAQVNAAQSEELTKALMEKEKVIADLKVEVAQLQDGAKSAGNAEELAAKVKELAEKLAEYEIIEDDIANLSFYKAENTKLKNELSKIKGGLPGIEEATDKPEINTPTPPAMEDLKESTSASPESKPADNVMHEFEKAVEQKEALEKNLPPATPPSAPAAKSEDDLMKEFESVVEKELAEPPKKDEINPLKLMEEVEGLAKQTPPAAPKDDGKDSNQKLIEEFENFVNKG